MDELRLSKLREEILEGNEYSTEQKQLFVRIINRFLTGNQLVHREQDYYDNGYFFGYLLIASQKVENALKTLILNVKHQIGEQEVDIESLNKPLGVLIRILKENLECEDLFSDLDGFKKIRDEVVHNLHEVSTGDLYELEQSIGIRMPIQRVLALQEMLLILASHISNDELSGAIKRKLESEFQSKAPEYRIVK